MYSRIGARYMTTGMEGVFEHACGSKIMQKNVSYSSKRSTMDFITNLYGRTFNKLKKSYAQFHKYGTINL